MMATTIRTRTTTMTETAIGTDADDEAKIHIHSTHTYINDFKLINTVRPAIVMILPSVCL